MPVKPIPDQSPKNGTPTPREQQPDIATKQVILELLLEISSRYESGASELKAELKATFKEELEWPEITPELIMQVCLGAAQADDLVLGIIRDDLTVVSLSDQTRQMFERDIALIDEKARTSSIKMLPGELGKLLVAQRADAMLAQSGSPELKEFCEKNKKVQERVRACSHEALAQLVMLALLRETKSRARASAVLRQMLASEKFAQIQTIQERFAAAQKPKQSVTHTSRMRQSA